MLNRTDGTLSEDWAPLDCLDVIIFVPSDTIDEDQQQSSDSNDCIVLRIQFHCYYQYLFKCLYFCESITRETKGMKYLA